MNRHLIKVLWFSFLAGNSPSLVRAEDGSASIDPPTVMAVTIPPTSGAVVIEASTNLVDWTDVTMLFPNGESGLFIDTESTNYNYRFYRMRTVISAANNLVTVNILADLRALSAISGNADVTVRGYYAAGDGGGGQFYWDANSIDADDSGITILPAGNPTSGRWKRSVQSEVNARWFGAVGDGLTNDAPMIQAALNYVDRQGGGKMFLPKGTYLLSGREDGLKVGSDTMVEGAGSATVILSPAYMAFCNKSWGSTTSGNSNITIQNLAINCAGKGINGIGFYSVSDGTIQNVRIVDPQGYGVWLLRGGDTTLGQGKPTQRVTVSSCHISGVVDVGIECSGAVGCTIVGNTVTGTKGLAGYYAWNGATDCIFTGNVAEGEGTNNFFKGYEVQPADATVSLVPAAKRIQTQRISFVGNVARNVWIGVRVTGTPDNKPTDILVEGNSLLGFRRDDGGVLIWDALRVSVLGNRISGFDHAFGVNPVASGATYNGAAYIAIDNNTISGGRGSILYGNVGGSLNGNKFFGQQVWMYAWKDCAINDNVFINPGSSRDTVGLSVYNYNGIGSTGNSFSGNTCMDDRDTKYAIGTISFNEGNHDRNIITRNSARGAKDGARAFVNSGSGTNNIVADNMDR